METLQPYLGSWVVVALLLPSAVVAAAITVWKNKMIVLFHFVDICCITSN